MPSASWIVTSPMPWRSMSKRSCWPRPKRWADACPPGVTPPRGNHRAGAIVRQPIPQMWGNPSLAPRQRQQQHQQRPIPPMRANGRRLMGCHARWVTHSAAPAATWVACSAKPRPPAQIHHLRASCRARVAHPRPGPVWRRQRWIYWAISCQNLQQVAAVVDTAVLVLAAVVGVRAVAARRLAVPHPAVRQAVLGAVAAAGGAAFVRGECKEKE